MFFKGLLKKSANSTSFNELISWCSEYELSLIPHAKALSDIEKNIKVKGLSIPPEIVSLDDILSSYIN